MDGNPYAATCDTAASAASTAPTMALFAVAWFACVWSETVLYAYIRMTGHEPPGSGSWIYVCMSIALFGGPLFAIAAPWRWPIKLVLTALTPIAVIVQIFLLAWLAIMKDGLAGTQ